MRRCATAALLAAVLAGCLSTRSEVTPRFGAARPGPSAGSVTVLFVFRHEVQRHGLDTIPKLQNSPVVDFDDLFRDALEEIGNVSRYETFTEMPGDVNDPKRRDELAAARAAHDYAIEIEVLQESSFRQDAFMGTIAVLSGTLVPVPFDWDYRFSTTVMRRGGVRVGQYRRESTLSTWVEAVLIFAYPFYPFEGKREEIYSESLRDTFRQIEAEQVLKAQ